MSHRPPRSTTSLHVRDALAGLFVAGLVCLLALVLQALHPEPADAHVLTPQACRTYAAAHAVIDGPSTRRPAARLCLAAAADHAFEHCAGHALTKRRNACVIRLVFGGFAVEAITVATCESGLDASAGNGQYRGMFQMGTSERATYGHGADARSQADAAFRYFNASGRDWSPWECQP